eukprot:973511-Amphidinium_carterae.1
MQQYECRKEASGTGLHYQTSYKHKSACQCFVHERLSVSGVPGKSRLLSLTAVAYKLVLTGMLPPVSYMTLLDAAAEMLTPLPCTEQDPTEQQNIQQSREVHSPLHPSWQTNDDMWDSTLRLGSHALARAYPCTASANSQSNIVALSGYFGTSSAWHTCSSCESLMWTSSWRTIATPQQCCTGKISLNSKQLVFPWLAWLLQKTLKIASRRPHTYRKALKSKAHQVRWAALHA